MSLDFTDKSIYTSAPETVITLCYYTISKKKNDHPRSHVYLRNNNSLYVTLLKTHCRARLYSTRCIHFNTQYIPNNSPTVNSKSLQPR